MPMTTTDFTGDGVTSDLIDVDITLPDSGNQVTVGGRVQKAGQPVQPFGPVALSGPGVPVSGINYWLVQVDYTVGTVTSKTSNVAMPAPDANNLVVYQQTLPSSSSPDLVFDPGTTPDDW